MPVQRGNIREGGAGTMKVIVDQATVEDKVILRNLMQLYLYDYTEFEPDELDDHGLFSYNYLDHYWVEPGRHAFLVRADDKLAGFASVRTLESHPGDGERYSMAEFFIMRGFRRHGVGRTVAREVFRRLPGRWEIFQDTTNSGATAFWRQVIGEYTNGHYEEAHHEEPEGSRHFHLVQTFVAREKGRSAISGSPRTALTPRRV